MCQGCILRRVGIKCGTFWNKVKHAKEEESSCRGTREERRQKGRSAECCQYDAGTAKRTGPKCCASQMEEGETAAERRSMIMASPYRSSMRVYVPEILEAHIEDLERGDSLDITEGIASKALLQFGL